VLLCSTTRPFSDSKVGALMSKRQPLVPTDTSRFECP
jgi:hypothetical protein